MKKALTLIERDKLKDTFNCDNERITESIMKWRNQKNILSNDQFTDMLDSLNISTERFGRLISDYRLDIIEDDLVKNNYWHEVYRDSLNYINESKDYNKDFHMNYFISNFTSLAESNIEECFIKYNTPFSKTLADSLLDGLAKSLMLVAYKTIILELNLVRYKSELSGKTSEERYHEFCQNAMRKDRIDEFYNTYPVLTRILSNFTSNFINNVKEFVGNYLIEKDNLHKEFGVGIEAYIEKIDTGEGDFHQRGKSVFMITFNDGNKLMYKPKDLRIVKKYNNFINNINESKKLLPIKVYKGIYRETYAFEEKVEKVECNSKDEIMHYYRSFGQLLSVMYVLNGGDFHMENIIANGKYPVIVDLETILQQHMIPLKEEYKTASSDVLNILANSVVSCGLLPDKMTELNIDLSGLSGDEQILHRKVEVVENIGTDLMRISETDSTVTAAAKNIVEFDGSKVNYKDYRKEILDGFKSATEYFIDNKEVVLKELESFNNSIVRVLIRNTSNYSRLLMMSYHPMQMYNWLDRENVLMNIFNHISSNTELCKSEYLDLLDGDIPIFFNKVSSRDLIDSRGNIIKDYFEKDSYSKICDKIKSLNKDVLKEQYDLVKLKLGNNELVGHKQVIGRSVADILNDEINIDKELLLKEAMNIGDRIQERAVVNGNTVSFLSLMYGVKNNEADISASSIDSGLYNGLSGLGLFYLYLNKLTNSSKYDEIVENIKNSISSMPVLKDDPTVVTGYGSKIVFLFNYLKVMNRKYDYTLLSEIHSIAMEIQENIEFMKSSDWVSGCTSVMHIMTELYKYTNDNDYLMIALTISDRIDEINESNPTTLGGFSHGFSSLAFVYYNLYKLINDEVYLDKAKYYLKKDRELFNKEHNGWEDKRTEPCSCKDHWCHGSIGIGTSRILLKEAGFIDETILNEIDIARERIDNFRLISDDTLCHGNLGNTEFMLFDDEVNGIENARKISAEIINNKINNGDYYFDRVGDIYNYGLFMGLSSVGYQLLRVYDPEVVPSVLFLQ